MPNKRKCKGCEAWYRPEEGDNLNIKCCSQKCVEKVLKAHRKKQLAKAKAKVRKVKATAVRKKKNKLSTRKRAAKEACHAYIRFRDKGGSCICCEKPLGDDYQAGHFQESGSNSQIRYHEDNIHGQRLQCNYYRGGDIGHYEDNLRAKSGNDRVDYLLANRGGVVKRTADDLRAIEKYYKEKLTEAQKVEEY